MMSLVLVFVAGFLVGFLVRSLSVRSASPKEAEPPVPSEPAPAPAVEVPVAVPAERTEELEEEESVPEPEEDTQPASVPRDVALDDKASLTERLLRENLDKWIVGGGYLNQGMTLEELAAELMTNRTYLSGYINSTYNCTFKEFIYMLRIEAAIQIMMEDPSISVEDLGIKVGIPSASTFNRQFVKQMGVTPAVWKMSNLQKMG